MHCASGGTFVGCQLSRYHLQPEIANGRRDCVITTAALSVLCSSTASICLCPVPILCYPSRTSFRSLTPCTCFQQLQLLREHIFLHLSCATSNQNKISSMVLLRALQHWRCCACKFDFTLQPYECDSSLTTRSLMVLFNARQEAQVCWLRMVRLGVG